jgi:hypothetical protein
VSELLIVCVPGARLDTQSGLLRLVLVPRLSGAGTTLAGYGLQNWPSLIRGASFEIRLRADAASPALALSAVISTEAQDDVWATGHAEQISRAYQSATVGIGTESVVRQQYQNLDLAGASPPVQVPRPAPQPVSPPDFHRTIAMLREHPRVLRALGLIVDVALPRTDLDQIGASGHVSAAWPTAPAGIGAVVSPWTAYDLRSRHFLPASTRVISNGLVDLRTTTTTTTTIDAQGNQTTASQPDWVVTTMDVDAAVARLSDAKTAVESATGSAEVSLPALRTVGLTLLHRGQAAMLAARAGRGRANARRDAAELLPLTADQLLLGYRLDVKPRGQDWVSLTRRRATYSVGGITIGVAGDIEEGHSKSASAVQPTGTDTLRASEAVLRWDGWSLAVPRPPLRRPSGATAHDRALPYDFRWTYELDPAGPPLPTLRFGSSYQLRARVVDIAGGGLELPDPVGDVTATDLVVFGRLEPVPPPVVPPPPGLLSDPHTQPPTADYTLLGPGGALDVLVIRSDPAGTPPEPVASYPANDTRVLLPPPMNLSIADQHGVLDGTDEATWTRAVRAMDAPTSDVDRGGHSTYSWLPDRAANGVALAPLWDSGQLAALPDQRDWDTENWPDYQPKQLQVVAAADQFVLVDWPTATQGRVALPPGRQVSVEVSSTLADNSLDTFAAGVWATGHEDASTAAYAGRHPVVTPPYRLLLVHAVRRPLAVPRAALAPTRGPGETAVTLADPAQPVLGVDRESTMQVEVSAAWDEWDDAGTPTPIGRVVQVLPIERTATSLPTVRQEFGDTRHRLVTYQLTARSRFRQYFDPTEPEEAFAAVGTGGLVHVPSSARPPAPTVLSAVPAFTWETTTNRTTTTTTRVRRGGWIRVELASPWYSTGQDEALAVVVATDAASTAPDDWRLFTTISRDPIIDTPPPGPLTVASWPTAAGWSAVVRDQDSGRDVTVVACPVSFLGGRRYADIDLSSAADTAYAPLVSLSVGRYQPYSLPGLELSALVRIDYVPVLPTRTLTVTRSPGSVVVRLAGLGPRTPSHRVDVRLESLAAAPGLSPDVIEVTAVPGTASAVGWEPQSQSETTLNVATGPIPVPEDGRAHRLVVHEVAGVAPSSHPPAGLGADDPLSAALSERIVFVDVVTL